LAKRGKTLFKSVCLGKCKSRDLPKRLNLTGIAPEMNRLWGASIRELAAGMVREHAALLVWERENLRLTNIVEGADDEVEPSYQLAEGQQLVGTFHTHPYVTGVTDVVFSGTDFASALTCRENLSIVHCGNTIAALARTELTPKIVDDEEIERRANDFARIYRHTFSLPETALKMNFVMCQKYKLGFYLGNITGQLRLEIRP